jgi:hypothetical protein
MNCIDREEQIRQKENADKFLVKVVQNLNLNPNKNVVMKTEVKAAIKIRRQSYQRN